MISKRLFAGLLLPLLLFLFYYCLKYQYNVSASVSDGKANVSLMPSEGSFLPGDTINTRVFFNPAGNSISGIAVRIIYPFSGTSPEIVVEDITINSSLTLAGDWSCPTKANQQVGSNVVIDIACGNTSAAGFTASADTLLANIGLKVLSVPSENPVILRFDPTNSVITRKSDNQDILAIPVSTATYFVGADVTLTPTPIASSAEFAVKSRKSVKENTALPVDVVFTPSEPAVWVGVTVKYNPGIFSAENLITPPFTSDVTVNVDESKGEIYISKWYYNGLRKRSTLYSFILKPISAGESEVSVVDNHIYDAAYHLSQTNNIKNASVTVLASKH